MQRTTNDPNILIINQDGTAIEEMKKIYNDLLTSSSAQVNMENVSRWGATDNPVRRASVNIELSDGQKTKINIADQLDSPTSHTHTIAGNQPLQKANAVMLFINLDNPNIKDIESDMAGWMREIEMQRGDVPIILVGFSAKKEANKEAVQALTTFAESHSLKLAPIIDGSSNRNTSTLQAFRTAAETLAPRISERVQQKAATRNDAKVSKKNIFSRLKDLFRKKEEPKKEQQGPKQSGMSRK